MEAQILSAVLSAVAGKIAALFTEPIVAPIVQWLCYPFEYDNNMATMEKQLEMLRTTRARIIDSVGSATKNGEEIQVLVTKWLTKADETIEEARKVLRVEGRVCLNLMLRYRPSREAKKIVQVIDEMLKNGGFEKVSNPPATQQIVTKRSIDYFASKSRTSTVTRLMEALKDDTIHLIGVWGMAGVGKSTMVREVANQAKEEKLFDEVVIANVTQSPDLKRIQGEITDTLRLKFDEETELGRADRLLERLSQERKKPGIPKENLDLEAIPDKKTILVILDDIWKKLNLEAIGIPSRRCKVLLTSRDRNVLVSEMDTQKDFQLGVLDDEEAWSLFEKMTGDCVNKDPNLRCTAIEVAKVCVGLPLALVTVSKALKNKKLFEWKDALQLLRRPAPECLNEMQSTIYSSMELSYKHLKESNKEALDVFLLCSQLGYYILEKDLLKYCYGLGLFHGINTMEDARCRLYKILRILKDCCLLLQSPYSSESLRMHDVVRDATKLIASQDHNMIVLRADDGLKEWSNANALKRCEMFSTPGGDIHELPNEMKCPKLRFLYVYFDGRPLQISDTFFQGMEKLKVLDLTKIQLSSLPSSLHFLENLQTLCLDQCVLGDSCDWKANEFGNS